MILHGHAPSIRLRLTQMVLLVSSTALLVACVAFFVYDLYSYRQWLTRSLATEAQIIAANSVSALIFDDHQAAQDTMSALEHSPQVVASAMFTADGKQFAAYQRKGIQPIAITPRLRSGEGSSHWAQGKYLVFGSQIQYKGRVIGSLYVIAQTDEVFTHARTYLLIAGAILALCLGCAMFVAGTYRRVLADPLIELSETARVVSSQKDYSVRANRTSQVREIEIMVDSFNEMLHEIEAQNLALRDAKDELEQRVQDRTADLIEANRDLEAFSYSVAHDLRGPLEVIGNIGYLLHSSLESEKDEESLRLVDQVVTGTQKMSGLISDLLNLSRSARTDLRRKEFDLGKMASDIATELQASEPDRAVRFIIPHGLYVVADDRLLCVVMDNLMRNAWKYASKRDVAEIEVGRLYRDNDEVFFVRDNGAGFDPAHSGRLFKAFQRLHTDTEFAGTGIGLATVQRIIDRHEGKVWAEGKVGEGATFFFTLGAPNTANQMIEAPGTLAEDRKSSHEPLL